MGQRKTSKGLDSLSRATDILSTLLAQQVRELNARQRENRRSGAEDPGTMKGLKEATAVLKDLAARPAAEKAMHWSSRHCVRWIFRITER